jgi:RNA polymerase sigma-70 factor (ECF subfamily)
VPAADPVSHVHETVNAVYLSDSRRVLATLIRLLGDFDVAEEALHDAFRAALEQWPRDGVPANPRAWLVSAGCFKAIDSMRRRARFDALEDVGDQADIAVEDAAAWADEESVEDDRLRLIFTCCHPALSADAQVALTPRRKRAGGLLPDRGKGPERRGSGGLEDPADAREKRRSTASYP